MNSTQIKKSLKKSQKSQKMIKNLKKKRSKISKNNCHKKSEKSKRFCFGEKNGTPPKKKHFKKCNYINNCFFPIRLGYVSPKAC